MTDIVDELRARALQGRFNLEAADEIERLRAELSEQCRLLGMSGEREAKHLAQIAALEKERDALRAELDALKAWKEEAEKQEPKAWMLECQTLGGDTGWILSWTQSGAGLCDRLKGEEHEKPLYARPTPAQSVTEVMKEASDHIIDFLQSQYDTEGITENGSGAALIFLSDAIAAVEEVLLTAAPKPEVKA